MANDAIHDAVVDALVNENWTIIKEQFSLRYQELRLSVDIAAKKSLIAQQGDKKILVEVKSFSERSFVKALQAALGQYRMYRDVVTLKKLDFELYLAISQDVYSLFFHRPSTEDFIMINEVNLLIVDIKQEKVVQWIK